MVSFATEEYRGALEALRQSALTVGGADEFRAYDETDVAKLFAEHPEHLKESRGYGWWAWKPYLISKTLKLLDDGDILVYCDSTMVFTRPVAELAVGWKSPCVRLFRLGGWEKNDYRAARWTKAATFERGGITHANRVQVNAGIQVYRNCPEAREFVGEYLRWCLDLQTVNDDGKDLPGIDDEEVIDHRHDQSVLTLLAHEHVETCVDILRDVTQHGVDDPPLGVHDPARDGPIVFHHRQTPRLPKVAVITPTTGGPFLEECIASVQASEVPNVEHWIVTDGEEYRDRVERVLAKFKNRGKIVHMVLPRNVGAGGWNGHRVYASTPWLIDADYVCFLDDDNTVDPNHYRDLLKACAGDAENPRPWAHSLRRIVDRSGAPVCDDNCESLGGICHTVAGRGDYLIDTSCYMMERPLAIETSRVWNARFRSGDPEPDRELCKTLLSSAPGGVVRKHSVAYRLGSTPESVKPDFFIRGNETYGYDFAKYRDLYVFHFSAEATARMLRLRGDTSRSHALDEWQMTLWRGLDGCKVGKRSEYNLIDGFSNAPNIPHGATVLVSMCDPNALPLDFFAERGDLKKIVYTLESPNVRHQKQWDIMFLRKHFDVALTYWKPLLDSSLTTAGLTTAGLTTVFAPHNTHHGDLDDPLDRAMLLRDNRGTGRSCAMVLERRPELFDLPGYEINGVQLKCLDRMREDLVVGLDDVTVFGIGWRDVADGEKIKLGHDMHRSVDPKSSVDILQDFVFAVIVENCDAEWYASEKCYDALSAGCVPLYWGSVPPQLEVPEGPETGVYIDLRARGLDTGAKIQEFIDNLPDDALTAMRRRVVDMREGILRKVGTEAFAEAVVEAIRVAAPET